MDDRLPSLLLVLVVLGSAVSPVVACESSKKVENIAKKFIKQISTMNEFEEWRDANIATIIPSYDFDGNITAYIVEILVNEKYAGYIVVSAKKINYPVLEFSKGKSPIKRAEELGIRVERIYRVGGLAYFFKEGKRYYDLSGKEVNFGEVRLSASKLMENEIVSNHLANRAAEARDQWRRYNGATDTSSWYSTDIHDVPAFKWDDGCAPTAAAMVLEYWGEHGYQNLDLPDWWYYESTDVNDGSRFDDPSNEHTDLIEELHYAMGTDNDTGSTLPFVIDDGINKVLRNRGYSNWASNQWFPQPSWDDVTKEISAGRPFVLSMWHGGTGSGWSNPYGDHSVTCVGYAVNINTGEKFLLLHDTWDYDNHYLAWGDWWAISATWVKPS